MPSFPVCSPLHAQKLLQPWVVLLNMYTNIESNSHCVKPLGPVVNLVLRHNVTYTGQCSFIHSNFMHRKLLQSRKTQLLFLREESKEMILNMHLLSFCLRIVRNTVFGCLPHTSELCGWDLQISIFLKHHRRCLCIIKFKILTPRF